MKNFTLRFTILTCLMLFAGTLFAQWQVKNLGVSTTPQKLYVKSADTAFIVGTSNYLFRTINKGATWTQVTDIPTTTPTAILSDIAFLNYNDGFIANSAGLIYYTSNKGNTWTSLDLSGFSDGSGLSSTDPSIATSRKFQAVACSENTVYISVRWVDTAKVPATHNFIYKSTNKGVNWIKLNPANDMGVANVLSIEATGQTIYIAGSAGIFKKSTDGGTNWIDYSNSTAYTSVNDIRLIDANTLYLSTGNGVFKTTDGGTNITSLSNKASQDVLYLPTQSVIFSAGTSANIVRSINDGSSWEAAKNGLGTAAIFDLTLFNDTIYAASTGGNMYKLAPAELKNPVASFTTSTICNDVTTTNTSENCGSYSWNFGDGSAVSTAKNPSHTYTTYNTYTISLTATNAVTSTPAVTHDVTISMPTIDFTYLPDVDIKNKIAFTNTSSTCKSYSWDFKTGTKSTEVSPIFIFPKLGSFDVTLSGNDGIGTYTTTKTITIDTIAAQWSYMVTDSSKILQKLYAFNNDTAIIAGNSTTIIRTADGGSTWANATFPIANEYFNPNDILFFNDEAGYITFSVSGTNNGFILKTTDNGQNWSQVALSTFSDGTGIATTDPTAATSSKVSFFSMAKTSSTTGFVVVRWYENTTINHGYVYKTTDAGSTWSKISTDIYQGNSYTSVINSIAFDATGTTGYIGGVNLLLKTIDGGATWSKIPYSAISASKVTVDFGSINDMIVKDANTIYLATQYGTIKTTNGFTSGKVVAADYSFDIVAINDSTFLSGKDAATLKITRDYGATWVTSSNGIGSSFYELAIFNNKIYALANYGKAYISLLDFYNVPVLNFTNSITDKVVTFTNLSTNAKSYSWAFGDTQTSVEVSPSHTYTDYRKYSVTLNGGNLCWKATPKTVEIDIVKTGIETEDVNNFQIWPNPASQGFVNLSLGDAFNGDVDVTIFDIQGRLISSQKIGSNRQINVDLNPGMYLVKVVGNNITATQKLIVK